MNQIPRNLRTSRGHVNVDLMSVLGTRQAQARCVARYDVMHGDMLPVRRAFDLSKSESTQNARSGGRFHSESLSVSLSLDCGPPGGSYSELRRSFCAQAFLLTPTSPRSTGFCAIWGCISLSSSSFFLLFYFALSGGLSSRVILTPHLEFELIQSHMAQKPVLRGEVGCPI